MSQENDVAPAERPGQRSGIGAQIACRGEGGGGWEEVASKMIARQSGMAIWDCDRTNLDFQTADPSAS
jgi:3'-phosphoadenosine 5'-phosphosulfate (PAPS) 3'-phosphatase